MASASDASMSTKCDSGDSDDSTTVIIQTNLQAVLQTIHQNKTLYYNPSNFKETFKVVVLITKCVTELFYNALLSDTTIPNLIIVMQMVHKAIRTAIRLLHKSNPSTIYKLTNHTFGGLYSIKEFNQNVLMRIHMYGECVRQYKTISSKNIYIQQILTLIMQNAHTIMHLDALKYANIGDVLIAIKDIFPNIIEILNDNTWIEETSV